MTPILAPDDTFDRLARLTAKAVASTGAFVSLADCANDEIVLAGLTGLPELASGQRLTLSETICRHVVATGEPLAIDDTIAHPLARDESTIVQLGIGAYLGVPLISSEGEVVGVLCTVDRVARPWSATQIEIAEGLAAAVMTEIGIRDSFTELHAAEVRYRGLVETIPIVVYMNDAEPGSGLVYISPQVVPLLGYALEEWKTNPGLAYDVVHPDDRERAQELSASARACQKPTCGEFRYVRKDGGIVWVVDHTIPVLDENGETLYCQGFLLDITESKLLEERLRQSQKMEAVGQLAGGIAHDFNNMLTAINGYAELIGMSFEDGDPRLDDVGELKRAAGHAAALTRQLLAFSRNQVLLPQRLDANEIVRELERMLRRTIGEQIELRTELTGAPCIVEVDPDQLKQVVMNIALNARDAMPAGGWLTITTRNVELEAGPHVAICVIDTGCGMDEETQARLYEPFFTTKEVGKGTGLGLATAYGIVQQSGGWIEVASTPGAGSTFQVLLPHAPPQETVALTALAAA